MQQKEVAEMLQISPCALRRWETNRARPAVRNIPKIIRFLGYNPHRATDRTPAEQIIFKRGLSGLSQRKLAYYLGISRATVSRWEQGLRRPDKELMKRLEGLLLDSNLPNSAD